MGKFSTGYIIKGPKMPHCSASMELKITRDVMHKLWPMSLMSNGR